MQLRREWSEAEEAPHGNCELDAIALLVLREPGQELTYQVGDARVVALRVSPCPVQDGGVHLPV